MAIVKIPQISIHFSDIFHILAISCLESNGGYKPNKSKEYQDNITPSGWGYVILRIHTGRDRQFTKFVHFMFLSCIFHVYFLYMKYTKFASDKNMNI